jgi:hypothetical protein
VRRFFQIFWAILAAVIFVPVLGGFFSEWAKELGWYEHPTARVETVTNWLFSIAFHPAYLLVAGLVLGLALGMWMDLVLRRREFGAAKPSLEWVSPKEAFTRFGKEHLVHNLKAYEREGSELLREWCALHQELEELGAADAEQYVQLTNRLQSITETREETSSRRTDCWHAIRWELYDQLREGRIIARGFLDPHTPGKPAMIIPPDEWRFLRLDEEDDKALGPNFDYIALQIARAS